ncbi:MAG: S8 family serine peptidase, partial [Devosia nanyangense]|nr:S8 family serine peptidase [Devosia nanyangense]
MVWNGTDNITNTTNGRVLISFGSFGLAASGEDNIETWGLSRSFNGNPYNRTPIQNDDPANSAEGLAAFSSRGIAVGPQIANTVRVKPDIVAPGSAILSLRGSLAHPTANNFLPRNSSLHPFYMFNQGTSMATPLVAGMAGLLREYFDARRNHSNPTSALLKADLINGARDMAGQHPAGDARNATPNHHEGWGLANLPNSTHPGGRLGLLSFAGVMVVVRPGFRELELGHITALLCVFFSAATTTILRVIAGKEQRTTLIAIPAIWSIVFNGLAMLPTFHMPTLWEMLLLAVAGIAIGA